ncbi:SUMF1/EgtB/PvdO family nonheme iron enzyme [Hymenobacter crusticola]|uniref:Sulfatase-modifying factor enzyme-like domain-containing protein n=1 Tax=Hymenobacter crusticola TaxID=1770526 RepID=A0A243W900_9BACT|nr:SUMF1/EgtB/PvdO family nonheme iron enzyme [Hymenobacter crusticola]OUJ70894.1 hypothetical protein BXP70_23485 [Hymenobacter crusticola]
MPKPLQNDTVALCGAVGYGADSGWVGAAVERDKWLGTLPVGFFPPNAFGLYDTHGNVLQYVEASFTITQIPADGSAYKEDVVLHMTGRLSFMNGKKPVKAGW